MIAAVFLGVLLLVSLLGNVRQFAQGLVGKASPGRHFRHNLDKVTIEHNRSRNNIVVVRGTPTSDPAGGPECKEMIGLLAVS
jgi:hypothetical protein